MAPAAINNEIPPSIGIHGGGQQPGLPLGGGGGGGSAMHSDLTPKNSTIIIKNLLFILFVNY